MMKKQCTFTFTCFLVLVCLITTALLAFNVDASLIWIERYVFVLLFLLAGIRFLLCQEKSACWATLAIFVFSILNSLLLLTQVEGNVMKLTIVLLLASLGGLLSKCSSRCNTSASSCKDPSCSDSSCSSEEPSVEVYNAGREEKAHEENNYVNIDDLRKFSQEVKSASSKVKTAKKASKKTTVKNASAKTKKHAKKKHNDDLVL